MAEAPIIIVIVGIVPIHMKLAVVPVGVQNISIGIAIRYFCLISSIITDNLSQNYLRLTPFHRGVFYEAFHINRNLHQNQTSSFLYLFGKPLSYLFERFRPVVLA